MNKPPCQAHSVKLSSILSTRLVLSQVELLEGRALRKVAEARYPEERKYARQDLRNEHQRRSE